MSEDSQMLAPAPNNEADHALLPLPGVLDLAAAERLYALMTGRLENGGPLRIDASAVETLTYPCVQIILAAMRTYDGISVENPSTAFISAFEDLAIDWKQAQTQSLEQAETQSESPGVESVQPPDSR